MGANRPREISLQGQQGAFTEKIHLDPMLYHCYAYTVECVTSVGYLWPMDYPFIEPKPYPEGYHSYYICGALRKKFIYLY